MFTDIEISIMAECESPSSSSSVFQYGVKHDEVTKEISVD